MKNRNFVSMNKNIIYWPRIAGLGDAVQILAAGLVYFGGERFCVLARKWADSYANNLASERNIFDLFGSFQLCDGIELDLDAYDRVLESKSADFRILMLKDGDPDLLHARALCHSSVKEILPYFASYFKIDEKRVSKNYSKEESDKFTICMHLRYVNQDAHGVHVSVTERGIDLEKWKKFIVWLVQEKNARIILIGESDPTSHFYIQPALLEDVLALSNVEEVMYGEDVSVQDSIYHIIHSELFIGGHSGMTNIAMLLGKRVLSYDWAQTKDGLCAILPIIQKRYWLLQDLDEMKELYEDYINEVFVPLRDIPVDELCDRNRSYFQGQLERFMSIVVDQSRFFGMPKWYYEDEAFFVLGEYFLKRGFHMYGLDFLARSDRYIPAHPYRLYRVARTLLDNGSGKLALYYLSKTMQIAERLDDDNLLAACNYHSARIALQEHNVKLSRVYLEKCLSVNAEHAAARIALEGLSNNENTFKTLSNAGVTL